MAIPYILVISILALLFVIAAIWLHISLDIAFASFMVCNSLYVTLWFAIVLFVISFFKSSAINAVSLLSIWLLLTLVLPAAVNNYVSQKYTVPESLSTMLKQRDGYHKKWDEPKDNTTMLFYKQYPQYKNYQWKAESFDWLWYYAMQHLGDVDARADMQAFMTKLKQREAVSKNISYCLPTLYTQLYNSQLAQTNLENHLQFLDSTAVFHERLRLHFYPKIFTAAPVSSENWIQQVPQICSITSPAKITESIYLALFILAITLASFWRFKNYKI